jgi:PAS domain-containing protein
MKARDKKQLISIGNRFVHHTTLLIVIFLLISLGWYMVERQAQVLTQTTIAAYQQTELEIVRAAARSTTKYMSTQVQYHPEGDVTEFEQEIFTSFIAPIHLLENGDAWIYAPDHVVFDLSADFPDRYRGKSMAEIFALQAENGASHYEEMTDAVMNAREGVGWYIWLPDKGKEIAAWTPVRVGDYVWTIGVSTPLPEILEATGASVQIRTSRMVMGVETIITLGLLATWWVSTVQRGRAEEALRESMEQLKFQSMLLEEVRDSITATDLEGRIIYMNRTSQEATGLTLEEALGQTTVVFGE